MIRQFIILKRTILTWRHRAERFETVIQREVISTIRPTNYKQYTKFLGIIDISNNPQILYSAAALNSRLVCIVKIKAFELRLFHYITNNKVEALHCNECVHLLTEKLHSDGTERKQRHARRVRHFIELFP